MVWQKSGTPDTLTVAGDTIEITDLDGVKFNQFMCHTLASGLILQRMRLNAIATSTYASRDSANGGTDSDRTSQTSILIGNNDILSTDEFSVSYCFSIDTEEKLVIAFTIDQNTVGAANVPFRYEVVGKHAQTTNAVTQVRMFNIESGDYAIDSNLSALGTD